MASLTWKFVFGGGPAVEEAAEAVAAVAAGPTSQNLHLGQNLDLSKFVFFILFEPISAGYRNNFGLKVLFGVYFCSFSNEVKYVLYQIWSIMHWFFQQLSPQGWMICSCSFPSSLYFNTHYFNRSLNTDELDK